MRKLLSSILIVCVVGLQFCVTVDGHAETPPEGFSHHEVTAQQTDDAEENPLSYGSSKPVAPDAHLDSCHLLKHMTFDARATTVIAVERGRNVGIPTTDIAAGRADRPPFQPPRV